MEFAWNLRIGGERVRFQPEARVYGEMVSRGGSGAASQRQRWESGRQALRPRFRRELWSSPRLSLLAKSVYEVDLDFPPLSRLVAGLGLASLLAIAGASRAGFPSLWSFVAAILALDWLCLVSYIGCPIFIINLPLRYLLSLIHLPYYMAWKLTIGRRKRPVGWVRTPREAPAVPPLDGD